MLSGVPDHWVHVPGGGREVWGDSINFSLVIKVEVSTRETQDT